MLPRPGQDRLGTNTGQTQKICRFLRYCKSLVLLGEVSKYVAVSVNRMAAVTCTDNGLEIELRPLDDAAASPVRAQLQPTEETVLLAVAGLGGGGVVTHFAATVRSGAPTRVVCHADHAVPRCTSAADELGGEVEVV
jgi:hypothetical protein